MSKIYERWGKEQSSADKFRILKNRLIVLAGSEWPKVTHDMARLLAFSLGKSVDSVASTGAYGHEWHLELNSLINGASTNFEVAEIIEAVLNSTNVYGGGGAVGNLINKSGCGIRIVKTKDRWLTYPAGEGLLDSELVEKTLSFLEGNALMEYGRSLDHYKNSKWEECAEKSRRSLEEYLRAKLNSRKGLQALIPLLGKRLKDLESFPPHLRSTVVSSLNTLDKNFNESSKHNSNTFGEEECEFLIYQVALLMRLLSKIEFGEYKK